LKKLLLFIWPFRSTADTVAAVVCLGAPVGGMLIHDYWTSPDCRDWNTVGLLARIAGVCAIAPLVTQRGPRGAILAAASVPVLAITGTDSVSPLRRREDIKECAEFGLMAWAASRVAFNTVKLGWHFTSRSSRV